MDKPFRHGDILYSEDTGEYLMLMERVEREYPLNDPEQYEPSWDMLELLSGSRYWEWEHVLEGSGCYEVVA